MPSYIVNGSPVEVELDSDFIAVKFSTRTRSVMEATVAESGEVGNFSDRIELPQFGLSLIPTASAPISTARSLNAVNSMNQSNNVSQASAVYRRGDTKLIPTGRIILAFREGTDRAMQASILRDHGLNELERTQYGEITAEISNANENTFDIAEQLSNLDPVDFAEPDLVTVQPRLTHRSELVALSRSQSASTESIGALEVRPQAVGPDPLRRNQYYLNLLQADEALALAKPNTNVTVAILDEGVDTTHPDLGNVVKSFDGTDNDTFQEPKANDAHGTACAGIVGATANNQLGIRGVAAGCALLAVRIAFSDNTGRNWVTTNEWIARSIDWSWENNADVLSNSWGGGSPSNLIIRAFERARTRGRNGQGAVIVIAAGNADGPVDFPGNLSNVLTVAASNQDDEPKTKTSSDGETWWGSNFGSPVDVAAPGVRIATTDITGDRGYSRSGTLTDYTLSFNGTSSACPQVAAVCALILARNPNLKESEVRQIIRDTADKVGSVNYDANGHHERMGQGRVNALKAARRARRDIPDGRTFVSTPNLPIPDADSNGVTDTIEVATVGSVQGIEVEVDISHTYRGDLRVTLTPPNADPLLLQNRTGGSAKDLKAIYTIQNSPPLANFVQTQPLVAGRWTLNVSDLASRDIGVLNKWRFSLDIQPQSDRVLKVIVPTDGTIPDNQPQGLQSETNIALEGSISDLKVEVNITHTWRGDLEVSLRHGDLTVPLHERQGGSQDNLFETYTMDNSRLAEFRGREASGLWQLKVADRAFRDIGKLSRWTLEVTAAR